MKIIMFNTSRFLFLWFRAYKESRIRNKLILENLCDSLAIQLSICDNNDNLVSANWKTGASNFNLKFIFQEFVKAASIYKIIKRNFHTTMCIVDQSRLKTINFDAIKKYVYPLKLNDFYSFDVDSSMGVNNWIVYFHPKLTASEINVKENSVRIGYWFFIYLFLTRIYYFPFYALNWLILSIHHRNFDFNFLRAICISDTLAFFFKKCKVNKSLILTSNSYFVELIRFNMCILDDCDILEILHGIPSNEILEYHRFFNSSEKIISKTRFVSPVFNLHNELNEAFGQNVVDDSIFVNLTMNRLRDSSIDFLDLQLKLNKQVNSLSADGILYVTMSGGAGNMLDYVNSVQFKAERKLIDLVKEWGLEKNQTIYILYSVHPMHIKTSHVVELQQYLTDVTICFNSFYTWLVSDLVLSLYSSSLWDAKFLGAKVFCPIRVSDDFYTQSLLASINHPDENEDTKAALLRVLESLVICEGGLESRFKSRLNFVVEHSFKV